MTTFILNSSIAVFEAEVLGSDKLVLVELLRSGCRITPSGAPAVQRLAVEYAGKLKVVQLCCDKNETLLAHYEIRNAASFLFVRNGEILAVKDATTAAQLRLLAQNWLEESFFPVMPKSQALMPRTISFIGEEEQKIRCLNRLSDAKLGSDNQPSSCIEGRKNLLTTKLGMPVTLSAVIDTLCWLLQAEGEVSASEQAHALIDAIPVGVDLGAVPSAFARWLLYDRNWGIARYYSEQLQPLLAKIKTLHDRKSSDSAADQNEWRVLSQQVLNFNAGNGPHEENQKNLADILQKITIPLAQIDSNLMARLCGGAAYLAGELDKQTWWTESEQGEMDGLYKELYETRYQKLGDSPTEKDKDRLANWEIEALDLEIAWERQKRQLHASLWERWDAWGKQQALLYARFNRAAIEYLLRQFSRAPRLHIS
ncbi:thioredoxin family protein [Collimonas pratensis]|uniref:Thioredoxin family protein n=1 Tax=Collimonas pratensis TaxID=279113 RepID=A0A127Q5N7_9BURK|nr:thioredoxin domain-containing protein [Collimonas pratensis]AMP05341.1 thioredoxin family protein [Collimonas pratensis]